MNGGTLNHEDWLNKMRDVTRLADEHEETATLGFRELLNETETAKKRTAEKRGRLAANREAGNLRRFSCP